MDDDFELSKQLSIEVVGVEYSGYGTSSGTPSPQNTYADVEAAYEHVVAQGVPPERIVAYGQSVGSGPATYLASKYKLGGLILHAPLMSGIKVIDPQPDKCCRPSCVFHCCDFYPSDTRLKKATSPTFIIHGQRDDIVPFYHGLRLCEMLPEDMRWPGYFPAGAGHNDILETNAVIYFQQLKMFLRNVHQRAGAGGSAGSAAGMQEKPGQVEMQETGGCILGVREADRLQNDSGGVFALSYKEPVVGPEDGIYANLRREKAGAGAGKPLQPTPFAISPTPGQAGPNL